MRLRAEKLLGLMAKEPMVWNCVDTIVAEMMTYSSNPECSSWSKSRYSALLQNLIRHHDQLNQALHAAHAGNCGRASAEDIRFARDIVMKCGNDCWQLIYTLDQNPELVVEAEG